MFKTKVEIFNTNYNESVMELVEKDGYYYFPFDTKFEFPMCEDDRYNIVEVEREV